MKPRTNLLLILFALAIANAVGQPSRSYQTNPDKKRANVWYFGQNAGVNFNTTPPTALTDGKVNTIEGCASMCDTAGNLLFYTDGDSVWDGNHKLFTNGTGLEMYKSATQGALIVPQPEKDSFYYIFILGYSGLQYSIANPYSRHVVEKNKMLFLNYFMSEQLSAVKHRNGRDVWISYRANHDTIVNYLLTPNGLIIKPYISKSIITDQVGLAGCMKFSHNGQELAINNILYDNYTKQDIEIGKFNSENAIYSGSQLISNVEQPYGLEFSDNQKFIYVTEKNLRLSQFDISSINISQSKKVIADISHYDQIVGLQMGYDNRIYMAGHDSLYLGVIQNPNDSGVACDFVKRGFYLSGKKSDYGTPNFVQSIFYTPSVDFLYKYDCVNNKVQFSGLDTFGANTHNWKFTKVNNGSVSFGTIGKSPLITFTDTGLFRIQYVASLGGRSDTVIKYITVIPKVNNTFLGRDTAFCANQTFNIALNAPIGMHFYQWNTGDTGRNINASAFGTYSAVVTVKSLCQILDTIRITILPTPAKSILTKKNDTLTSSEMGSTYRWFFNGIFKTQTTVPYLHITQTGKYQVEVTNASGCKAVSDTLDVTQLGIFALRSDSGITIYPNPVTDVLKINAQDFITQMEIYESNGKQLQKIVSGTNLTEADLSELRTGFYLLKLTNQLGHITCLTFIKE